MTKKILLLIPFLIASCYNHLTNPYSDLHRSQGHMIFEYGTGKLQCLSEIDPDGETSVLIQPLTTNTLIESIEVGMIEDGPYRGLFVVDVPLNIKEPTDRCASWTNMTLARFIIDNPRPVNTLSLKGELVFRNDEYLLNVYAVPPESS